MAVQYDSKKGWGGLIVDIYKAKRGIVDVSEEATGLFEKYQKNGKDLSKIISNSINSNNFDNYIKQNNLADESLIKFLKDSKQGTKDLASYQEYLKTTGKQTSRFADLTQKAGNVVKGFGAALASMAVMWAIGQVVSIAMKAIDDNIHRLENAKEALADTESQLSDVKTEIESTTEKIKELEALGPLSIVDEHDLQTLKDQNEELRIRQQYLEKQKLLDQDKVAEYTKQKYNYEGGSVTDEEIADYRSLYGSFAIPSQSKELANLIAQYQYYSEERAKAVTAKDQEAIDKWDAKLNKTTQNLMDSRTKLQEWSDSLGDEASPELEGITSDLERIDDLLLSPGQKLTNFINSDSLSDDKTKLIELIKTGKLTEDNLTTNFKEVDAYLKENNLTLKDLISVTKVYKDELDDVGNVAENAFTPLSKSEVISNITSLSEGFESLDKIMKSVSDKDNPFDYALLDDTKFKDNFGELGESYTNFIETISDSPNDVKATQSAFNDLVTEWIDSEGVLTGLTDETANLAVSMLQNMGVANAEEVVMNRLALAHSEVAAEKYYNANASDTLNNATISEVDAFVNSGIAAGVSGQALSELALQKLAVNNVKIDTSSDIDQVIGLANAAGASATVLSKLAQAKSIMAKAEAGALNGSVGDLRQYESARAMLSDIENGTFDYQTTLDPEKYKKALYNGGPKTNKDSGSGKDKKDTSKDIDWIDRQLKLLDDKRSELLNKSNDAYIDYLGITRDQFNRAQELFNSDLESMPSGFDELGDMARNAGMTIAELYSLIANGFSGESRQSYLEQALEVDKEALATYGDAVQKYQEEYDKSISKISPQYRAKIENGDLSIDTLSGDESEEVQKAITDYDKLNETKKAQYEKQKQYLQDIAAKYDNVSASIQNENKQLENSNSVLEKQIEYYQSAGTIVDSSLYNKLSQNTADQINNTRELLANKRAELQDMVSNGVKTSSEEYINLKGEISDAEINIYALKKAQEDYNNMLLQLPIDNLATIVSMYQDIGSTISNWSAEYEAGGGKLNADYYQNMISNSAKVTDSLREQASLIEDTMSNYDVGSDRYLELYKQLRSVNSEMSSTIQNMKKLNEEMLKLPLENIGGFSSELQKVADGLSSVQTEYDTVISAVTGAIQNQIDLLNKQGELETENRQSEIDALKEKLDLLNKENEYRKLLYDIEKSQFELERARNQNTNRVIRNGETVYESDQSAVSDAQQNLLDSQSNLDKYNLQQQIDDAQKALDIFNEGIEKQVSDLQAISTKWSEISEKIAQAQNEAAATGILGKNWQSKILSGNDKDMFNMFQNLYATNAEQLKNFEEQAHSTANIQSLLESYVNSYREGTITYKQALTGINGLLAQLNKEISASSNLQNIYDYLGTTNNVASNADAILNGIQSGLSTTADELIASLEQYNKNSGMISEYTSSWQQLTDNVKSMLDVLKEVRDNLEDSYDRDDDDDDKTSKNGWDDSDAGNGPGVSRKDGITRGLIGSTSDSDREASMKLLGLKKLDPDEVPAVLHMGEAVFNEEQQKNLLNNFASAQSFVPKMNIPNYSDILSKVNVKQPEQIINISHGDLSFPNVRNIDDAITEFAQLSEMAIRQELAKR